MALSTKNLSNAELEEIIRINHLIEKYGAEELIKVGLLSTNSALLASEKTISIEKAKEHLLTANINEELREMLISKHLSTVADGKEATAKQVLIKELLDEAVAKELITSENAKEILSSECVIFSDNKEIASKEALIEALKRERMARLSLVDVLSVGAIAFGVASIAIAKKTEESIEEVRNRAKELSDIFNDSKSSVDDYKSQIDDLYSTIRDSSSSVQEVTTARQTLMTVQDELIDKFGDEKETIDLITQAINGQSTALDELTQKKWQATKNDFNKSSWLSDFGNWQEGYSDNIDRMVNEMENAWGNIKMSTSDYFGGEYDDIIKRLEETGWKYSSSSETFVKDGSVEDLYEEILDIQTLVGDDMPDNFLKSLTKDANELKATLDSYEGMWNNYILNDKIFADDNLADSWKEVNDAYTKYQNAVASGDKTAIEEATSGFATSINEVLNDENVNDSVKDYFKDMYPALYREVEKWEFKTNIIPEFDTKGLQGKTQADVIKMLQTNGTQEGEDVFNSIVDSAIKYGLILDDDTEGIQKILDLLIEWGILQGTIVENQEANKTADLLGTTATITSSVQQIASQLEPQFAKLGEAYKNIFTTDGFTLENVDNSMLEDLRTTFSDIGEEIGVTFDESQLEPFFDALTDNSGTSEEQAERVQQAFNNLATSYFYSTDTLDKLNESTAEAIQKQLEELNVVNAKEVVYDTLAAKTEAVALEEQFLAENGYALKDATEMKTLMFLNEAGASETARQYLFQLVATEKIFNNQDLNAKQKIEELEKLALAYGQTALAAKIANMEKAAEAGHTQIDYDKELASLQAHLNDAMSQVKVDFKGIDDNASEAGKDAAEEYKEALEKELSDLDKVLSFITDTIQDQIDLWNDQKDAAVDALEAQRDAAVAALEAQKEAVQEQIDAKQDEIDKIKEARKERQAEIDLQQKQYELARLQNQKTRLVKLCQTL